MNSQLVRCRFAPSPTGNLHLGGVRTALFNYLFAKANKGKFILRIEDTDKERSQKTYEENIFNSLKWLGLNWDEGSDIGGEFTPYRQSERQNIYEKFLQKLKEKDLVYKCFCTPEELEFKRQLALKSGKPPRYDGTCKKKKDNYQLPITNYQLNEKQETLNNELSTMNSQLTNYTYRLDVEKLGIENIKINDLLFGEKVFAVKDLSDFIIFKGEQQSTFLLANALDDALMQINYVIRGEDHLSNTPRQILILKALDLEIPQYLHLPIVLSTSGKKLSKREEETTAILDYKNLHYLPSAIINFLAFLGWSPKNKKEIFTLEELVNNFNIEGLSKSPAVFSKDKLLWFNHQHFKLLSNDQLKKQVEEILNNYQLPITNYQLFNKCIDLLRDEANDVMELVEAVKLFLQPAEISITIKEKLQNKKAVFKNFVEYLNANNYDEDNLKNYFKDFLSNQQNIAPKEFFPLLREILIGTSSGIELQKIFLILSKEEIIKKVEKNLQYL